MSIRNKLLQKILDAYTSGGSDVPIAYCDYLTTVEKDLDTTLSLVTDFAPNLAPQKVSYSNGRFTAEADGVYSVIVEREYHNHDQNPTAVVNITIDMQINGVTVFTKTEPVSAATSPSEPAIVHITTPILREITAGDYVEFYVSGEDGGGNPSDLQLTRLKLFADLSHNLPV